MKRILFLTLLVIASASLSAQNKADEILPVRGLAIAAPTVKEMDSFVEFIEKDLAPAGVNLLILRVDWNFAYKTHPELRDPNPLSENDVKRLVGICRSHGIRVVPHINLLGHQSWAKSIGNLLKVYPEFDENPSVKVEYYTRWPNPYGLYCKSYCPLHPDVHKVVFDIVDELCDAFEADGFHAGMDEVFYLGEKECPRCSGRDEAELYAGEVTLIRNHLALKGRQLLIWGDRLLDGRTTGLGEWEASYNHTARAIDLIPKDVFICDWHYGRAELTGPYFALKGLPVAECGYDNIAPSVQQVRDMVRFRAQSNRETRDHLCGYIHTIWVEADIFLRRLQQVKSGDARENGDVEALMAVLEEFKQIGK